MLLKKNKEVQYEGGVAFTHTRCFSDETGKYQYWFYGKDIVAMKRLADFSKEIQSRTYIAE